MKFLNAFITTSFRTTLFVVIVLTTGCAGSSKYAMFQPVPEGSDVHVVAVDPELKKPDAKSAGETVGKETAKGAAIGLGGGLVGGTYLSVMCGPAIIVCAPILVPGGAVVGLVGGSSMGGAKAGREALPKEKAKALEKLMSETFVQTDFSAVLQHSFESRGGNTWNLTTDDAETRVILGVEALDFTQYEDDVLVFNVTTSMIVQYGPEQRDVTRRLLFTHRSTSHPVDYWLAEDGKNLRDEMEYAFNSTVTDMVVSLDWEGRQR